MKFRILIICLALAILTGCGDSIRRAETKGIKIGELAPKGRPTQPVLQLLQTTNIDITTYELPAANIKSLDEVWQILPENAETLRYIDANGFAANGLRAATGEFSRKGKITEALKSIKAKKLSTTSLLIQNGQVETLSLGRLTRRTTIAYIARGGAIESADVGPATLGLQVYARQITPTSGRPPGAQIISRVQITPVISASTEGLPEEVAVRLRQSDLRIYSAGFGLNMKPGDIILLAPGQYISPDSNGNEPGAASRFFTRTGQNPMIKVLLFVCTSIT